VRGRKPKPAHLKVIEGNRGRRPIRKEIQPEPICPPPPAFLGTEAKREWRRIAPALCALRILSLLDIAALGAYCSSYGLWSQATDALAKEELIAKSAKGNSMANILIGISNKAAADMVRYAAEFGMTPSARARLGEPPLAPPGHEKYFS